MGRFPQRAFFISRPSRRGKGEGGTGRGVRCKGGRGEEAEFIENTLFVLARVQKCTLANTGGRKRPRDYALLRRILERGKRSDRIGPNLRIAGIGANDH